VNQRILGFLIVCLILVYGMHVVQEYKPWTFALYDPGWMVSTAMSIAEDGDLDLRNQLKNDPSQAADQTSLGKNGQWYPLHEFLMPLATVPFFMAFGINGCLIFNVLILTLSMVLLFKLCARHVDAQRAFIATVLTAFQTLFLSYAYSYSLEVFGTFLLLVAYWCAVKCKPMVTGFVWGLATYARLANAVTMIGFLIFLYCNTNRKNRRQSAGRADWVMFLLGGAPLGICFFATNWFMFGSPMTTSYDRWQHFVNGQGVVSSQRGAFSFSILERLPNLLMDQKSGLLIGAPLIILAIVFGMRPLWHKARDEAILLILTCCSLILLFSKYSYAVPGTTGNRYLMPVVALCAIPLAFAVQNCFANMNPVPDMEENGQQR